MRPFFLDTNHHADCAEALLTAMARRHPRNTFMSARFATNLLLREGECVSLEQVQEGMRQLQKEALGLVVEDQLENIGFLWEQAPCVALARKKLDHQFMPTVHVDTLKIRTLSAYQDPMPEHVLQLRDKCAVRVSMPEDLSEDEIELVTHFVMALVDLDSDIGYRSGAFPSKRKKLEDSNIFDDFRRADDGDDDDDEFGHMASDDDEDLDEDRYEDFDDLNDEDDDEQDVDDADSEKKSGI